LYIDNKSDTTYISLGSDAETGALMKVDLVQSSIEFHLHSQWHHPVQA
jgi:hypothetical protein